MDSLCHPWFTTTNVSYRFPILKLPPPPCAVLLVNISNNIRTCMHTCRVSITVCLYTYIYICGKHQWQISTAVLYPLFIPFPYSHYPGPWWLFARPCRPFSPWWSLGSDWLLSHHSDVKPVIPGHFKRATARDCELSDKGSTRFRKWVCLKIGYIPNYSHLIGIMIINHWV